MYNELKSQYDSLLDMYRSKENVLRKELNEYKKKHPLLPATDNGPQSIRAKNNAIRGQYTRRENKIHSLWDEFYSRLADVVSTLYNLPNNVSILVIEQVRASDLKWYEHDEVSCIDEYAEFTARIIDATT